MGRLIDTKDERESRRRHECDGEERSNDQDAAALGCCEEFADSAAKIVTPMCAMATDRVHVFGPTRDVAKWGEPWGQCINGIMGENHGDEPWGQCINGIMDEPWGQCINGIMGENHGDSA